MNVRLLSREKFLMKIFSKCPFYLLSSHYMHRDGARWNFFPSMKISHLIKIRFWCAVRFIETSKHQSKNRKLLLISHSQRACNMQFYLKICRNKLKLSFCIKL
jgi:hypothetical protein